MSITCYGIIARVLSFFIPIKERNWVLGADYGNMYREGPRFMLEYMLKKHQEYKCTFITMNRSVKNDLDRKGIPCELNLTLKGMIKVARAEVIITSQVPADVLFAYKKRKRKFIYLGHGQPYKAAYLSTPKSYAEKSEKKKNRLSQLIRKVCLYFIVGYDYTESLFYISTSEFLVPYNRMFFGKNTDVRVIGMPRNDVLFDDEQMKKERWVSDLEDKLVITYMPTHRDYGAGSVSPLPFISNNDYLKWMRENDVVLVVKQHPNMVYKVSGSSHSDVVVDISKMNLDPQVCLYHSDALITDYSSVFIDYLLLKRPILFYYYDNYEAEDTGILYDLREDPPGHFCYNEDELFNTIKKIKEDYSSMTPSERIVRKYNKYVDGDSCERCFNEIIKG